LLAQECRMAPLNLHRTVSSSKYPPPLILFIRFSFFIGIPLPS